MAQSGRSDMSTNVDSLVSSLEDELRNAPLWMPPSYCIFKTPNIILFRHREISFIPNRFSFGPMNHARQTLVSAEKIKIKYLKGLLSRGVPHQLYGTNHRKILIDCTTAVKLIEREASACYEGHDYAAELGDEFVKLLVLDGCFIIELFRKDARVVSREEDDPIFSMSCMLQFLNHDLILLENQVPWFVLETLYEKTKLPSENLSLIELALCFFSNMFSSHPPHIDIDLFNGQNIKHILDLLRSSLVLSSEEIKNNPIYWGWEPLLSISRLKDAGVKFERAAVPASILDIKFRDGSLEIPSFLIQETTETILRNLIAYEQCLPHCQPIITSYARLLDNLITIPNDVEILCKKIYDNWLRTEDAAHIFSNLSNDTYLKEFYYSKLYGDLNRHCKRLWPRCRAYYLQTFTKPWAVVAQVYAFIMFFFTFWQTFIKKG